MTEKLRKAEELIQRLVDFHTSAIHYKGLNFSKKATEYIQQSKVVKKKILKIISELEEENKIAKKKHAWMKTITKLKEDEQKAFWWAAEFTNTVHDNNIQKAWEDYKKIKRQKALDELTALSQEMGDYE